MAAAWNQIGDVLEANRRIRFAHLAREVAGSMHRRHVAAQLTADPGRVLALSAPVHRRVMRGGATVSTQIASSLVANGPLTAAMRRVIRPGARLARTLGGGERKRLDRLILQIAAGKATPARPKRAPGGALTTEVFCAKFDTARNTVDVAALARRGGGSGHRAAAAEGAGLSFHAAVARSAAIPAGRAGQRRGHSVQGGSWRQRRAVPRVERGRVREAARAAGRAGDGRARRRAAASRPYGSAPRARVAVDTRALPTSRGRAVPRGDGLSGVRHRHVQAAVRSLGRALRAQPEPDPAGHASRCSRPTSASSRRTWWASTTRWRASCCGANTRPTSKAATSGSSGTRHRNCRCPARRASIAASGCATSRRCTTGRCIRSSVSTIIARSCPGAAEEELVLVIRGELLKRYPTAVIYAQRAQWVKNADGTIDLDAERELADLTPAEELAPPRDQGAHAALRSEGRSRHLLLRLRSHGRGSAAATTRPSPTRIPAGSSSFASARASRASASTSSARAASTCGTISPGTTLHRPPQCSSRWPARRRAR